ncbi:dTDP-4-dehydrorhamnose reductase [Dermacoccus barathri]|uniref:dTDP-4-dehydrorhamnose reductase n=1 Tax=Dermacoccus barathri TaxID=322601 RepID=A0ABN2B493_9MICO
MSRWVITGGTGMFGTDLAAVARDKGHEVVALGSGDCDIRDLETVRQTVAGADVVVNAAAYTAVDAAETDEAAAFALNATGAHNVAVAAREAGAKLVHISTDYVFDGSSSEPYDENTPQNPQSAYGRTKAAGEWAVRAAHPDALVVRTAWLYGEHGPNFVTTMLRLAGSHETLHVVDDQHGQPTWTLDLAHYTVALLENDAPGGYYHGTSEGSTTWFDFTREIFRLSGLDPERVQPTTSDKFPRPAPRPANSVLAHRRSDGGLPIWGVALADFFDSRDNSALTPVRSNSCLRF